MDYFAPVRNKPQAPPVRSAQVAPLINRDGVTPYAASAIAQEVARLCECSTLGWNGPPWDTTTFEVACNLLEFANSPWAGYSVTHAESDFYTNAPTDENFGRRKHEEKWRSAQARVGNLGRPEPLRDETPAVTVLDDASSLTASEEDAFWSSRDLLEHVHTFARARMVAPWAVLGCVLARVITATPHQVSLPPVVGSKASLNLFVGLVGPSGSGKGAAEAVAAEAVSVGYIESHNVGSGEGIAHGYKRREKGQLVWNDDRHAVLFSVPEIDSFAAQGDRKGATLMPQLRSGWTGEQLGFGYADPLKRIIVEAHQYRLCLVAGIQPGRAACLLDDADGGTPQRFLWMPATDPNIPDEEPEAPPPMTWEPPATSSFVSVNGVVIEVCQTARKVIKEARRARVRGDGTALDGHALLAQLKTAAALGIADGRYSVNDEDWRLAGVIAAKSAATRAEVVRHLAQRAEKANVGKALSEADRVIVVTEKVTDAAVRRVCGVVVRRLRRAGDWATSAELRRAVASTDRGHLELALERLLETGQIVAETVERGHRYRLPVEGA